MEAIMQREAVAGNAVWINGRRWDLIWLIGSAIIVPIGLLLVWADLSSQTITMGVTVLVGGPHLFATYLATYMDPRFRRSHAWVLAAATLVVPAFVVAMTLWNFQVLLSLFIFTASAHVLQQNAYLAGVYRNRAGRTEPIWSRLVDAGVLALSFYPIASYKLNRHQFLLGDVEILIPDAVRSPWVTVALSTLFAALLAAWVAKTVWERRRGVLNPAKTLLIGFTCPVAFLIPAAASGDRLELAFQAVNCWHSIQYLALVWLILKIRKERGLTPSRLLSRIGGTGRPVRLFYGLCLLTTAALLGAVLLLQRLDPLELAPIQYYYMGVLSALLIHYVLDGYLFAVSNGRATSPDDNPYAALSR